MNLEDLEKLVKEIREDVEKREKTRKTSLSSGMIIEYQYMPLPFSGEIILKLYENGIIQIYGNNIKPPSGKYIDHIVKIEFCIPSEQVKQYADKLVNSGFFNFNESYNGDALDGWEYNILLNYQGNLKEIKCHLNEPDSSEFKEVIKELDKLVEAELYKLDED